ncbi:MAG: cupin domain-containing protein [Candidatus Omnitrophica bacterium]|nr:cupin domain-containing protein [Candidatus Omnitrophota bacterium]
MQKKSLNNLVSLKQLFKNGVVFLFLGLLVSTAAGCGSLKVNTPSQKTTEVPPIEVHELARSLLSWDGTSLPAYPTGHPEITILRIVIPPGAALAKHKHPVINAGVLLKGELTVQTENGKILHLKAGDALVEVVDTWHYGKNEGAVPAEIIVFYAGTEGAPITVHKSE